MVVNGRRLLSAAPIKNMLPAKCKAHGVSHGLTEAGYDIRIAQDVTFRPAGCWIDKWSVQSADDTILIRCPSRPAHHGFDELPGRFALASSQDEFNMPSDLVGYVKDKSTWARLGLSVFNTVIEPGWKGFLTLELVYHGRDELVIPAGAGIAQVLFHQLAEPAQYDGKYQDQESGPVEARHD